MIKNIVFDMGGVILDWAPRKYIDRFDIPEEDKKLLERIVFKSYQWPLLDNGYYESEQDFLDEICPKLPERLRPIAEKIVLHWDDPNVIDYPGMADIVRQLKENGYNIYLVSNAGPRHREYWPKIAAAKYFDGLVISAYEKQYKPGKEIFNILLKRYNLKADECVFTDDLATNCAGAFLVGMHPIVFYDPEYFVSELRKLGVKI